MTGFLKVLKGYVRIRVCGFSPERFMNLCSNRDILLWDIVQNGEIYEMNINIRSFYLLRPIVKKTGTKVVILQRYGLPFFLPVLRKRKVFLTGMLLSIAFWIISSLFIWEIDVTGNYQITDDVFQSFLEEKGVRVGIRKDSLNIEELEKTIRKEFVRVTWTSAKLTGTKLQIAIKENDAPIMTFGQEADEGKDLIAEYDGIVVAMIVRSGVPLVAIGDTVEKGMLLVDGKVPVYNEDATIREYQYVNADADILVEHNRQFQTTLPFDYVQKEYTGRTKKKYYLRIGETEWKMPENQPFLVYDSLIKESRPLFFQKLSIPVYCGSYTHREYQNVEYEYTLEQAQKLLNEKLSIFLATLHEKGVQIIEKNVKIDTNGGKWIIKGDFLVREPCGKSVETVKPDIGENKPDE